MSIDLFDLDLRFLIARYGRRRVLEGLAKLDNIRTEDLDAELNRFEKKPRQPNRRAAKTADEVAAGLKLNPPERYETVRNLARRFDSGTFLGTLSEVDTFLRANKIDHRRLRSRKDAGPLIVRFLASLEKDSIEELTRDLDQGADKSEFYHLAHQIMGRPTK